MSRGKRIGLGILAGCLSLCFAFLLWCHSPGPEWMARRTAEKYLDRHAAEYSFVGEVITGVTEARRFGVELTWPSWTAIGQTGEGDWDQAVRLELTSGWFPWRVTKADWWTPEAGFSGSLPIP